MSTTLSCSKCNNRLKRCIVHPCRNLKYDFNDTLRYSHLCGICIKCNVVADIYFVNDTRVYFPPLSISQLQKLPDLSFDEGVHIGK